MNNITSILQEIANAENTNSANARIALDRGFQAALDRNLNNFMATLLKGNIDDAYSYADGSTKAIIRKVLPERFPEEKTLYERLTDDQQNEAMKMFCNNSNISLDECAKRVLEKANH